MLLVTGGMGHVGFEIVQQASAANLPVLAQYNRTFREADAAALGEGVRWVRCDLSDPFEVAVLAEHPIDGCIHTAAVPNERLARPDPRRAFATNVSATETLLELARRRNWRRFVNVSTGSVFQQETDFVRPILEDWPTSAQSTYSVTKRCGELLTTMYRSDFQLSAASVRISWVYGPPLVPNPPDLPRGPIPVFLRAALAGQPVRERSGEFAASFTYVADVAAGLLAAYRAEELAHDVYHLGSGVNNDTYQVATAVLAAVPGADIEIEPGTEPWTTYTTMRGPLAGDRLSQDTDFTPTYSLEDGIAAFAEWMRSHPETYR